MNITKQQENQINELIKGVPELEKMDLLYHIENAGDTTSTIDELTEVLENNNAFIIEKIYYKDAIDYLTSKDPSLQESLALAHDLGYTADKLDSTLLASLLASENVRIKYNNITDKLEQILFPQTETETETN